jgi:CheY-like chemotaxis protein
LAKNESDVRTRVLLVEDVDWIRAMMRASLEARGYVVAEARDEREAVASAERARPRLVLTEEELPTFGALMRSSRAHPALARVPVAVINPDAEDGALYDGAHVLPDYEQLERLLAPHAPVNGD